jgi:hypothetical protein
MLVLGLMVEEVRDWQSPTLTLPRQASAGTLCWDVCQANGSGWPQRASLPVLSICYVAESAPDADAEGRLYFLEPHICPAAVEGYYSAFRLSLARSAARIAL